MRTFLVLFLIIFLFSNIKAQTANKIDKLDVNQLKLPKETVSKATYIDATGQVRSSTVSDTELGYLSGLTELLTTSLTGKANDADVVKLTGNQSVSGVKTFTGKIVASSTTNGSIPCPVMTEVQRDAFTPVSGDCVYNSTTLKLNVFDGSVWKDVGGAGGISLWLTANPYNVNDIVINSDKIYRCLIAHTSGTFATDLAASKWGEVSSGLQSPVALADGGTGRSLTASAGSIVYVDADSFEIVSGTSGQILQSNGTSAPSFVNKSISGKSQQSFSSVTIEEIQFPNNQLTQVDTNKFLNETGNNNILVNPSFEHSTPSTGWTNLGTAFFDSGTSVIFSGKQAALYAPSVESISIQQISTLNASNLGGSQGLASVRVKSDSPLKVCAIINGTVSTSLCVDVQTNNKWGLYKIPFILGSTSNGISIASAGNIISGLVYIDDAFVGAADLTQNINACNDVNCETEFSAKISLAGAISSENLDWLNTCTVSPVGTFTCSYNSGIFTVEPNCTIVTDSITNGVVSKGTTSSSTQLAYQTTAGAGGTPTSYAVEVICQKQGADFTAAKQLSNGNTYSSTNADTDWASCSFSTLAWQGFGTVTSPDIKCKRQGSDLLMRGRFTTGTVTASEARIPLPTWSGGQLVVASSSSISILSRVGGAIRERTVIDSTKELSLLSGAGYSYLNVSAAEYAVAVSPFSPQTGSGVFLTSQLVDFSASIPIEGWQNSNIIIAELNGLQKCASTLDCTDTFSAKISSAGVVSDENVTDFINGNCTNPSTGNFICTFTTNLFTVTPNCTATPIETANTHSEVRITSASSSASQLSYFTLSTTGTGAFAANNGVRIICQKQGVDYIGKTAKAVASDQSIATPGITKVKSCYVRYSGSASDVTVCNSSPCTVREDTCGGASVTMPATAEYVLTFPSGEFAPNSYVYCSAQGSRQDTDQNMWYTNLYDSTLQTFKSGADGSFRHNFGFYNGGSYSYNFGNIKCEGKAP
jgi:hypothetical protein